MQRFHQVLLGAVVLAALVAGCTSSTTVRDDDPGTNDDESVSAGGRATPGFEGAMALAAVGASALVLAMRRRRQA